MYFIKKITNNSEQIHSACAPCIEAISLAVYTVKAQKKAPTTQKLLLKKKIPWTYCTAGDF